MTKLHSWNLSHLRAAPVLLYFVPRTHCWKPVHEGAPPPPLLSHGHISHNFVIGLPTLHVTVPSSDSEIPPCGSHNIELHPVPGTN
jgi:hypothetical protein